MQYTSTTNWMNPIRRTFATIASPEDIRVVVSDDSVGQDGAERLTGFLLLRGDSF
jgi:hypothetical protein